MPQAYIRTYYHFVWATWDRLPLLEGALESEMYRLLRTICKEVLCPIHALNGMPDHIHLVVSLPQTLCIADFLEKVKGVSSRAINEAHGRDDWAFKWQGGYGVQTVSPNDLRRVRQYVENQQEHHRAGTIWDAAERVHEEKP